MKEAMTETETTIHDFYSTRLKCN